GRSASTPGDNDAATIAPASAAGTKTRNQRWSVGASVQISRTQPGTTAASAPRDPEAAATALYSEKPRSRSRPARSVASIAGSSDVNGPDSTTSVDNAPVNATTARTHALAATPNPTPAP